MKLVITGVTGFIGAEVLDQCLRHSKVTSVVAISRRPISKQVAKDSKLRTIILPDLGVWKGDIIQEMKNADGVIWCLGSVDTKLAMEQIRKIHVHYTMAGVEAALLHSTPALKAKQRKFRFVYLNGFLAIRDQSARPWFAGEFRKIRGQVENELIAAAHENPDSLDVYIARPAAVIGKESSVVNSLKLGMMPSVRVDHLAATLIEAGINGSEKQTLENADIVRIGKKLLEAK